MIEIVTLPEMVAIGIDIKARWEELHEAVPAAWARLHAAGTGAQSFLEASLGHHDGIHHELVGYLAAGKSETPDGMVRIVIAEQRYLKLRHEGPLKTIKQSFRRLCDHGERMGLRLTDFMLDFGYRAGLPEGPHELYVALAAEPLQLGG
jgi:predicted transcriptional regulator YdeE